MSFDFLVLGAGIVGVSVAYHLQQRGARVALVDRREPGSETSYGNGGLIQCEAVYPYAFPRGPAALYSAMGNRSRDVRYTWPALWQARRALAQYWHCSAPATHARIAAEYAPLIRSSVQEHLAMAQAADAMALLRPGGWMRAFRSTARQHELLETAARWQREYGVAFEALDADQLRAAEPDLSTALVGAIRYPEAYSVSDPQALVQAYAQAFVALGGTRWQGDARTLEPGWSVVTTQGRQRAREVVVALGPWADTLTQVLGVSLPLFVKRGYHQHYKTHAGASLNRPVLDTERGYLLAPMRHGIRLTTGVELALRDAPPSPNQLALVEPIARRFFPLGQAAQTPPWLGSRPCTPDMKPIIGRSTRAGVWLAVGHAHHGLTLGPSTGRLLAEMVEGTTPFVDPAPFRADRFSA